MNIRKETLTTGDTTALSAIAISGVVADEVKHREYLTENNITLPKVTYTVDSVELLEGGAIVLLREIGAVALTNGSPVEVSHTILININEKAFPQIISDMYLETLTGFASCSYVSPEETEQIRAVTSKSCFLYIANKEEGYLEKASNSQLDSHTANPGNGNYSKYGEWIGTNPAAWCASFVSWCANKALAPLTSIPHKSSVPSMASFYQQRDRFHSGYAYGGNYTPQPGDVVFLYWDGEFGHMGMVYDVYGTSVTIIHGNWGGAVVKETKNITDAFLTGYGVTNLPGDDHLWIGEPMLEYCRNCGAQRGYLR